MYIKLRVLISIRVIYPQMLCFTINSIFIMLEIFKDYEGLEWQVMTWDNRR